MKSHLAVTFFHCWKLFYQDSRSWVWLWTLFSVPDSETYRKDSNHYFTTHTTLLQIWSKKTKNTPKPTLGLKNVNMTQPATAIKLQEPSVQMQPNFFEEPNRHQRFCFLFLFFVSADEQQNTCLQTCSKIWSCCWFFCRIFEPCNSRPSLKHFEPIMLSSYLRRIGLLYQQRLLHS